MHISSIPYLTLPFPSLSSIYLSISEHLSISLTRFCLLLTDSFPLSLPSVLPVAFLFTPLSYDCITGEGHLVLRRGTMLAHSDIVCHNERQHGCDCRDLHHHPGRRRVHVHWLLALLLLSVAAARGAAAVLPLKQRIGNSDVLGLGPLPPVPTPVALSALSCRRLLALYQHGPTAATPSTTTASKSETHPAAGHEPTDGTTTSNRVGAVPEQPQGLLRELPAALVPEFTLDGRLPLEHYLVDDTHGGQGSHFRFPGAHVARLVARASEQLSAAHAAAEAIAAYPSETETHPSEAATETKSDEAGEATAATVSSLSSVPTTLPSNLSTIAAEVAALAASAESLRGLRVQDRWYVALLALLTDAAVAGRHALVFGTTEPWYEALLLAAGASSVTTVEYNELTIGEKRSAGSQRGKTSLVLVLVAHRDCPVSYT